MCPWCGSRIVDEDYWEIPDGVPYEVECPACERFFNVTYELYPVFTTDALELRKCHRGCEYWDVVNDICEWAQLESDCRTTAPMTGCPQGYDMEVL